MDNSIIEITQQSGLDANQSEKILDQFTGFFEQAQGWEKRANSIVVTDESQKLKMRQAREARLALKQIRIDAEQVRKQLKEKSLREGKAIDGIANVIKALIIPIEQHLEKQEKFAEVQAALKAEQRFNDRVTKLTPYVYDVAMYNLLEMGDMAFDQLLISSKLAQEAQQEAERKAEATRVAKEKAEREENKRIRKENDRLKVEADIQERKQVKEREKRVKAEATLKAKRAAERKAKEDAAEAERQAQLAPEKDKLAAYAKALTSILAPTGLSKAGEKITEGAERGLIQLSIRIRERIKKL